MPRCGLPAQSISQVCQCCRAFPTLACSPPDIPFPAGDNAFGPADSISDSIETEKSNLANHGPRWGLRVRPCSDPDRRSRTLGPSTGA